MLTHVHNQKCLQWSCELQNYNKAQWKMVAWSDKSHFISHHVDVVVHAQDLSVEEMVLGWTMGRRQAGSASVMLWAII